MSLRPWAEAPFELILHGELHYRGEEDFDRRMALISFDNSIEVTVTSYLALHPLHRQNKEYSRDDVVEWNKNFHTKLDFLELECKSRGLVLIVDREDLAWYHASRNRHYHEGTPDPPNRRDLQNLRKAAIWAFSVLYGVEDVEAILDARIAVTNVPRVERLEMFDKVIDEAFGEYQLAGGTYTASELLHAVDQDAYRNLAMELIVARSRSVSAA